MHASQLQRDVVKVKRARLVCQTSQTRQCLEWPIRSTAIRPRAQLRQTGSACVTKSWALVFFV